MCQLARKRAHGGNVSRSLRAAALDDSYGLDFDEHGRYAELCFTTDMSKVVLSEQQHHMLHDEHIATMRVYVSAASKRAVIVKEDDLLTKAEIQMTPQKISKALYTELKLLFDTQMFQDARVAICLKRDDAKVRVQMEVCQE